MRVTTQMTNQTAAQTGIAVNSVSLVNYLSDDDVDTSTLLDSLNTSSASIDAYEDIEDAASSLTSAIEALTDDNDESIFAAASESGDSTEIVESVKTLVESYNDLLDKLSDSTSAIDSYYLKALQKLLSSNSDELSALGITIGSDGSLSVDEDVLGEASVEDLEAMFGADSSFMDSLASLSAKVEDSAAAQIESTSSTYTSSASTTSSYTSSSSYDWWA